jgi:hypothetical protein
MAAAARSSGVWIDPTKTEACERACRELARTPASGRSSLPVFVEGVFFLFSMYRQKDKIYPLGTISDEGFVRHLCNDALIADRATVRDAENTARSAHVPPGCPRDDQRCTRSHVPFFVSFPAPAHPPRSLDPLVRVRTKRAFKSFPVQTDEDFLTSVPLRGAERAACQPDRPCRALALAPTFSGDFLVRRFR